MIIDEQGIQELNDKIKNPLNSIFDKLEATGDFGKISAEFELIFETLNKVQQWDRPNIQTSPPKNVVIDGKLYTPQIGG